MLTKSQRGCVGLFFWSCSVGIWAETFNVAISESAYSALPDTIQRVQTVLDSTGLEVRITVLPDQRAMESVAAGDMALELYRQPSAVLNWPDLIRIEPAIQTQTLNMITSVNTPQKCNADVEVQRTMSIAGVRGVRFFDDVFYPRFKVRIVTPGIENVVKLLKNGRADVSYWLVAGLANLDAELVESIHVCEDVTENFAFYSYLHPDYQWAQEQIEKAYQLEFGTP